MTLKGKTALITGSTSGIGLGIARAMAADGTHIVLNGFGKADEIEKIRSEIENLYGVECFYNNADMSKPDEIVVMIQDTHKRFGRLDILVNNAGIQHVAPVEVFPPEKWDAILAINLTSAFHTTRIAIPIMKKQGWGRIINMASAHGLVASPYKSAYVSSKHALIGFTKTIALEVAEFGITCNAICPGYVFTPLVEGQIADTAKTRGITEEQVVKDVLLATQATKKFVSIGQVAALALFLCSDAAENITGSALSIDGGWTAH
ncbi:MAG: 3-hydroxybutyrate dehydrogenase [Syntrophales bacterium]